MMIGKFRVKPKFPLGSLVATPGALDEAERINASLDSMLVRHAECDWGDDLIKALVKFATDGRETGRVGLNFKNTRKPFRGRAYRGVPSISTWAGKGVDYLVTCSLGSPDKFPVKGHSYPKLKTAPVYDLNDWVEAAVLLIAHELTHCEQFWMRRHVSEIEAERSAVRTLGRFRAARPSLGIEDKVATVTAALKAKADRQKAQEEARKLAGPISLDYAGFEVDQTFPGCWSVAAPDNMRFATTDSHFLTVDARTEAKALAVAKSQALLACPTDCDCREC